MHFPICQFRTIRISYYYIVDPSSRLLQVDANERVKSCYREFPVIHLAAFGIEYYDTPLRAGPAIVKIGNSKPSVIRAWEDKQFAAHRSRNRNNG